MKRVLIDFESLASRFSIRRTPILRTGDDIIAVPPTLDANTTSFCISAIRPGLSPLIVRVTEGGRYQRGTTARCCIDYRMRTATQMNYESIVPGYLRLSAAGSWDTRDHFEGLFAVLLSRHRCEHFFDAEDIIECLFFQMIIWEDLYRIERIK